MLIFSFISDPFSLYYSATKPVSRIHTRDFSSLTYSYCFPPFPSFWVCLNSFSLHYGQGGRLHGVIFAQLLFFFSYMNVHSPPCLYGDMSHILSVTAICIYLNLVETPGLHTILSLFSSTLLLSNK